MTLQERINNLAKLGDILLEDNERTNAFITKAEFENAWFTQKNIKQAIANIAKVFLDKQKMQQWVKTYKIQENISDLTVGIIMAGNIPLVGFHDLLCVLISGHKAMIKLSDKDKTMMPYLLKLLVEINSDWEKQFTTVDQLSDFDAIIATGSNNSARYFEVYFAKYPHIIRKNRNSIAVLNGQESKEEILNLGQDIFMYFGLGCRNVAKVFLPKDFDLTNFLEILHDPFKEMVMHSKYKNNFDYNFALHSINNEPMHINGCLIMREDTSIYSRISTLHYEFYDDLKDVSDNLLSIKDQIQVVISNEEITGFETSKLGQSQSPLLTDYADGVDVMTFLTSLK